MISKIQQCITSLFNLWILTIFLLTIQFVSSNNIIDLIHTIKNRTSDDIHSKINLVSEFRDILQTIQYHLYNSTNQNCFPGFHFYRGSCYYLSSTTTTWPLAKTSCSNKRNSSLAVFKTKDELKFVVDTLMKKSNNQLAFIGLHAHETNELYWLDGRPLKSDDVFKNLYCKRNISSACGAIDIADLTQVCLEERGCLLNHSYVCRYVQDYCYENNICGNGGSCISKSMTYMCKCNFLYHGKHCEKFSSKAIQTIIAVPLIILMGLIGCCLKFDLCSRCQSRRGLHSKNDLFNDRQMILETHERKKSLMTQY